MVGRVFLGHDSSGLLQRRLTLNPLAVRLEQQCRVTLFYQWPSYQQQCKRLLARQRWSVPEVQETVQLLTRVETEIGVAELVQKARRETSHWMISTQDYVNVWVAITDFFRSCASHGLSVESKEVTVSQYILVRDEPLFPAGSDVDRVVQDALGLLRRARGSSSSQALRMLHVALEKLEVIVQAKPSDARILNNLGIVHATIAQRASLRKSYDHYSAAVEVLRRAVDVDPGFYEGWYNLGTILWRLSLSHKTSKRYIEEMNQAFKAALVTKPDDRDTLYNWGTALATISEYERDLAIRRDWLREAIGHLRKLLKLYPGSKDGEHNLRVCVELLATIESSPSFLSALVAGSSQYSRPIRVTVGKIPSFRPRKELVDATNGSKG